MAQRATPTCVHDGALRGCRVLNEIDLIRTIQGPIFSQAEQARVVVCSCACGGHACSLRPRVTQCSTAPASWLARRLQVSTLFCRFAFQTRWDGRLTRRRPDPSAPRQRPVGRQRS